ncbi:hypothetical protein BANRA_00002 [Pseudomonas aeruginosa]|nr:hypothetical protein BANRA_00002 [Pseudomonas aeruginosa]
MKMLKRFIVKKNERGLLYSEGDFLAVLEPGTYRRFDPYDRLSLESQPEHPAVRTPPGRLPAERTATGGALLTRMDLGDNEAGLRYEDGVLVELLAPEPPTVLERPDRAAPGAHRPDPGLSIVPALVAQHQPNLRDAPLAPGRSVAGPGAGVPGRRARSTAPLPACCKLDNTVSGATTGKSAGTGRHPYPGAEVSGQEISPRQGQPALNAANWRYSDVLTAFSRLSKPLEYLYRELQFGCGRQWAPYPRRTAGEQAVDRRSGQRPPGRQAGRQRPGSERPGRTRHHPPGRMKTLAQVVEAEKAAQANVIRRREETSATRSLLNTAKVMENRPRCV